MTYESMSIDITQSTSASAWLREAIITLSGRDVCDVLNDLDTLRVLHELRLDEFCAQESGTKSDILPYHPSQNGL